jgi:hypothetical protein
LGRASTPLHRPHRSLGASLDSAASPKPPVDYVASLAAALNGTALIKEPSGAEEPLDRFHVEVIAPLSATIGLAVRSPSHVDHFNKEAV